MRTSLIIMAAGIGSRFGGGIKQLEPVGLHNEVIMDYSIHDAIEAGFNKIIIIIRKDIELDFWERIGNRVEMICKSLEVELIYVYQDVADIPIEYTLPIGRTKPWGTGQAVLAAKEFIREPFAVINADDYYGKKALAQIHDYLCKPHSGTEYCMVGFRLKNTLSEHGGVTRGICNVENGKLIDIIETQNIEKTPDGAAVNGLPINVDACVSMNMWGFPSTDGHKPEYIEKLEVGFLEFFQHTFPKNPLEAEFLLPVHIRKLLQAAQISITVLQTDDKWFGVTYKEDKPSVIENFEKLISTGIYKADLYADLLKRENAAK